MMGYFNYRFNSRSRGGGMLAVNKNVSRKPLVIVSDKRIDDLRKVNLKKRTEAKMNWGVKCYIDCRNERLYNFNYDV